MMLVTGPTSAVGNAVLKELLVRKIPVRAFVRQPSVAVKLEAQGVETFVGDMTERESVQKALQGIERVSLISPVTAHLLATEQLWAEEARKAGVHYLVKQEYVPL
ncbi:SDR family oxidoreductase [Ktedonobacter sp. SOSP1-52]|uniref:SDR family oxidoreductase n=1 Tax=Ktedonobacter sp. SOSP1-52 TaxID=2778366 RepID=UPI001915E2F5|nr:NAD(P)H-binding protein [Ktedonobacter sp. SOSP1-52]